jgi:hypothetical protein
MNETLQALRVHCPTEPIGLAVLDPL